MGEARSVVMLDNASTHMQDEVRRAIASVGAVCIFGAPYSPHLNPIEKYFSVYKSHLKRNERRMNDPNQWEDVHHEALNRVTRDHGIKFFRHSKIPGSRGIYTSKEFESISQKLFCLYCMLHYSNLV